MEQHTHQFKELLRVTLKFESYAHRKAFDQIPDNVFEKIFRVNFSNDLTLAQQILTSNIDEIDRNDLDQEIKNIKNYDESINLLSDFIQTDKKIILVTDTDNDGSSAQAITNIFIEEYESQYGKKPNIDVIFAQFYAHNPSRGITVDVVEQWIEKNNIDTSEEFLVVTADNGISSKDAQEAILNKYPNAKILITDHHIPNEKFAVYDSERSLVFDPMIEPKGYFKEKNISGAMVLGELLKGIIEKDKLKFNQKALNDMNSISWYSNMLDYVETDIRLKPLKEYEIGKYTNMGVLLNVNNSLNQIFSGDITDQDVENIRDILGSKKTDKVKDLFNQIKQQNIVAHKLLQLNDTASERANEKGISFDNDYMVAMTTTESVYDDFDFNHVSKLRPLLLQLSVDEDKSEYETRMITKMLDVFKTLKSLEREVINIIRESDLVDNINREFVDFMIPKNSKVGRVFNRKMLNKAYNIANNGFVMFVSENNSNTISGSFRSQYNISSILHNKKAIEKKLGINIEILGHEKAAGFYIQAKEGTVLDKDIINKLANNINKNITTINQNRTQDNTQYIETDLETLSLFNQINGLIRSNVGNVEAVPVLVKIKPTDYVTDKKTAETKNITSVLKESQYGYFTVPLTFTKDAILIPNGVAKEAQKENYSSYLYTNYINSGTFIASGVARFVNPNNIVQIKTGKEERKTLYEFFKHYYLKNDDLKSSENYSVDLTNEELKNIPYYKYNNHGNADFRNVEAAIINTLDNLNSDIYSICDVEATGLGQSPKLINIGFLNLRIDNKSGMIISKDNFEKNVLSTKNKKRYYITEDEMKKFMELNQNDYELMPIKNRKDVLFDKQGKMFYSKEKLEVHRIFNEKLEDEQVIINRQLIGESIAMLVNNKDTKITPDLAKLTNIDNWLINKAGIDSKTTDKILLEKFKNTKTIFETHNGISYDGNVIMSNLPKFSKYYGDSLQLDSIIFSKDHQLAYDDVNVASFNGFSPLKNIFFYCDEYCSYSLKNFLSSSEDGVYPDYSERYILKTEEDKVYLIDKKIHETTLLPISKKDLNKEVLLSAEVNKLHLLSGIDKVELEGHLITNDERFDEAMGIANIGPVKQNYRKFSVVKLGEQQMVRNMLLDNLPEIKYTPAPKNFSPQASALWDNFISYYHFDKSPQSNLINFEEALTKNKQKSDLRLFTSNIKLFQIQTETFLKDNINVHQRFKESWLVKRLLESYEPEKGEPLSKDRIELAAWETSIPQEKIEEYLGLILDFKEKYNMEDFYTEEKHNNIVHKIEDTPFEHEKDLGLGDVIQEGHVALNQLSNRVENNYDASIPTTEKVLNDTIKESTTKVLKGPLKTTQANSYSRAQAESYKNSVYADKILANINLDEFKIKLKDSVLPPDTAIFLEKNPGKSTAEKMLKLVDDVNFVTKISVIRNSQFQGDLDKALIKDNYGTENPYYDPDTIKTPLDLLVAANIDDYLNKVNEVYENNGDYYFSRADAERKKVFNELANLCIEPHYIPKNLRLRYVEKHDEKKYEQYINDIANYMEKNLNKEDYEIDMFRDSASEFMEQVVGTGFSAAVSVKTSTKDEDKDPKVLYVPVSKKDVAKFVNDDCCEVYQKTLAVCVEQSLSDKAQHQNKKNNTSQCKKPRI